MCSHGHNFTHIFFQFQNFTYLLTAFVKYMDKYTVRGYISHMTGSAHLEQLNDDQRAAVVHGDQPLLIVAGAGTGKTRTLTHRVAHLLLNGCDPARVLLLTFSRRAADEMTRRARQIAGDALRDAGRTGAIALPWSGTFHAVAHRLLRSYAGALNLDPAFSLMDRADSADLMNVARQELVLRKNGKRFPTKDACLDVYSRCVNAQRALEDCLDEWFVHHRDWLEQLTILFRRYVELKQEAHALDFDDLLLYWFHMCQNDALARHVSDRFDHVLIDEYQDTNKLQAGIVTALKPTGQGVTAVGDDAQAIYSFRCARVENIFDYESQFETPARVLTLTQNYRSQPKLLELSNALMEHSTRRYDKSLYSQREPGLRPVYARIADEDGQAQYVATQVLAQREKGVVLKDQAVLFRNAQHSHTLEMELKRRDIPYVKYGGLRFLEAGHIKDFLALLKWANNPRDRTAAFRVLLLVPGIGTARAARCWAHLEASSYDVTQLVRIVVPSQSEPIYRGLCDLLVAAGNGVTPWPSFADAALEWYEPRLRARFESNATRLQDLQHLCHSAARHERCENFLATATLDPPGATSALAGPPLVDDDYLILSTVHSAKGQEWDNVYLLNVVDGTFPSEFACGDAQLIEEERRLLYVAMTRAKNELHLVHPLRFFVTHQPRLGSRHVFSAPSRFLGPDLLALCEQQWLEPATSSTATPINLATDLPAIVRQLW